MLDIATISESVNNAAHEFPIKRVDLFGSYAEERQTEKSDVDLLIEFTSIAPPACIAARSAGEGSWHIGRHRACAHSRWLYIGCGKNGNAL